MDDVVECIKTVAKSRITYRVKTTQGDLFLVIHQVSQDSTYDEVIYYTPANGHAVCIRRVKLVWHLVHQVSFMDVIAGRNLHC